MISPRAGWKAPQSYTDDCLHQGDADETTPMTHFDLYATTIPHGETRVLTGRNHQLGSNLRRVADDICLCRCPSAREGGYLPPHSMASIDLNSSNVQPNVCQPEKLTIRMLKD
jgi:hypothetical protein